MRFFVTILSYNERIISMEIKGEQYIVTYDKEKETIAFQGIFRLLDMKAYDPIIKLLQTVAERHPPLIYLDLKELSFLNSSGFHVISKFVIHIRDLKKSQLIIKGANDLPWKNSLINLKRLMPEIIFEE